MSPGAGALILPREKKTLFEPFAIIKKKIVMRGLVSPWVTDN